MCGYKLAFMNATPSCLTVDLTRTKDFSNFVKDPILNVFFDRTENWLEYDTPALWDEGPEQGLKIFQVSVFFLLQRHIILSECVCTCLHISRIGSRIFNSDLLALLGQNSLHLP